MLPVSISAMRLRNMSVSTPAGMFIAPIAAARAPMIPPAATSLSSSDLLDVRKQQQQRLLVEVLHAVARGEPDHEPHALV